MRAAVKFAAVHREVEEKLQRKVPSALSPQQRTIRERLSSDVAVLDALMDSGLPVGAISEMVGPSGSGRTTAATAFAASAGRAGKVVAWVDVADAFDPASSAINGVDLERLLWVRCASSSMPLPEEEVEPASAGASVMPNAPATAVRGGGSPHPRTEINGMPEAIRSILVAHGGLQHHQTRRERKMIGTPGAPNRPLGASPYREEQIPTDRRPSRLAAQLTPKAILPCCSEPTPHRRKTLEPLPSPRAVRVKAVQHQRESVSRNCSWTALEHALRATDLLLQSGGFGLIVLDLGDTPAEMAWRVPLATWFRYRAGCERSRTSLLLLTQHPCARSSAELVMRFEAGEMEAEGKVLTGFSFRAQLERQRFATQPGNVVSIRKPPQSEHAGRWKGPASWAV